MQSKIKEVGDYIKFQFQPDKDLKIQLGVSGGKDSTACYLLFHELGLEFTPVFADTGNEQPATVEHALTLHEKVSGAPPVEHVMKTFPPEVFDLRRKRLREAWSKPHRIRSGSRRGEMMPPFPDYVIDAACAVMHPSGNNFLDMALLHGMFPIRRSQFCTLELKLMPVQEKYIDPWVQQGFDVLTASGVRADESSTRKNYPRYEINPLYEDNEPDVFIFRPILDWVAEDCFAMHRRHGIEPNPLYKQGMARVGCLPCIHAGQKELVEIYKRYPEELDRIEEWERTAALVSRWAQFNGSAEFISFIGPRGFGGDRRSMLQSTKQYIDWVGDKPNFDLEEEAPFCSSMYGLCE